MTCSLGCNQAIQQQRMSRDNQKKDPQTMALIVHPEYPLEPPPSFHFPEDKVPLLINYLDAKEICAVSLVNKYWYLLTMQESLWSKLCRMDFNTDVNSFVNSRKSSRSLYFHFEAAKRKHLKETLLSQQVAQLHKDFNLPCDVAFDLLNRYT